MLGLRAIRNPGWNNGDYNADIQPKQSIRIFGVYTNSSKPKPFDKTFKIGDEAEYNSYNLIYTGKIVSIGPKTVSIDDDGKVTRLSIYGFIDKNHDFNVFKVNGHNKIEMQCI